MASSPAEIVSTNPARPDDILVRVIPSGGIDVDRAVTAGVAAAEVWAAMSAEGRASALTRVAAAVELEAPALAQLIAREVGTPIAAARDEVARAVFAFRSFAAPELTHRRPRGLVGTITPFVDPVGIPATRLAPALAYGNACVWKPSPLAPATAIRLHRLIADALPENVVQLLHGYGDAGAALAGHRGVAGVSFTGTESNGAMVAAATASRGARAECVVGGSNAAVVLADADPAAVAAMIVDAAMGSAGQRCTATKRIVCEAAGAVALREAIVTAVEGCDAAPVISAAAGERALAVVERARAGGARVLTGGDRLDGPGYRMAPTVVALDDLGSELAQAEVFAPVCALIEVATADAAVAVANDVRHSLATSIFTSDPDRALALAHRCTSTRVCVNQPTTGGRHPPPPVVTDVYSAWRTISIGP